MLRLRATRNLAKAYCGVGECTNQAHSPVHCLISQRSELQPQSKLPDTVSAGVTGT